MMHGGKEKGKKEQEEERRGKKGGREERMMIILLLLYSSLSLYQLAPKLPSWLRQLAHTCVEEEQEASASW